MPHPVHTGVCGIPLVTYIHTCVYIHTGVSYTQVCHIHRYIIHTGMSMHTGTSYREVHHIHTDTSCVQVDYVDM